MQSLLSKKRLLVFLFLVLLLLLPATIAHAQDDIIRGDKVIFGGSFTLFAGQTLDGDLVVFGGTAILQSGSTVDGDVAVIGGTVDISGKVEGDVAVIGGNLRLGNESVIEGDVANLGGTINASPGHVVEGENLDSWQFEDGVTIPGLPGLPDLDNIIVESAPAQERGFGGWLWHYALRAMSAIAWAAILAVLGILVILFLPRPLQRVADAIQDRPAHAFGAGALLIILFVPLIIILAITICLIPLAFLLGVLFPIAWIFGWLAAGWVLGVRIAKWLNVEKSTPVVEIVIGVAILTLLWRMPLAIPFLGWLLTWGVALVIGGTGLGAVLLTRFGTRSYPSTTPTASRYPELDSPETKTQGGMELPESRVSFEDPPALDTDDDMGDKS